MNVGIFNICDWEGDYLPISGLPYKFANVPNLFIEKEKEFFSTWANMAKQKKQCFVYETIGKLRPVMMPNGKFAFESEIDPVKRLCVIENCSMETWLNDLEVFNFFHDKPNKRKLVVEFIRSNCILLPLAPFQLNCGCMILGIYDSQFTLPIELVEQCFDFNVAHFGSESGQRRHLTRFWHREKLLFFGECV